VTVLEEIAGRHAARRRRRRRRILFGVVPVVVVVLGAIGWFLLEAYPLGSPGPDAVFYVHDGEPFSQIVGTLAGKGVIGSGVAFRLDMLISGGTPNVAPGWYAVPTSSSFSSVRAALVNGPNALAIQVVGGETTRELRNVLSEVEDQQFAAGFYALARNGAVRSAFQPRPHASLEGLLAPGTYVLVHGERPQTLLRQMIDRFDAVARSIGLVPGTRRHGLGAYQLVVAASIVEKEGYYAFNMPKTATVIFNRLARGMPLQMDSTVEYALGIDGGPITSRTESYHSAYNTYLHLGLTPTPICSPSTTALRAVLHAPSGPWLYFVVVSQDGTMAFSSTFAEQLKNEQLAASRGL
jgi:UPF0755 protein